MKLEFHHINYVADDVDRMHDFYTQVLGLADIPQDNFPRTAAGENTGYDGNIRFATDGGMQMHLAERDFRVAFRNGQAINPVARGHIAFRTDDLRAFLQVLDARAIPYADYGTAFSKDWHQVFFQDPEGNVIEVHQEVATMR
ncbi:MAG: VOC family protein [Pseudomonadota bacterium]